MAARTNDFQSYVLRSRKENRMRKTAVVSVLTLALAPLAAQAHHGWGSYEASNPLTIEAPVDLHCPVAGLGVGDVYGDDPACPHRPSSRTRTWEEMLAGDGAAPATPALLDHAPEPGQGRERQGEAPPEDRFHRQEREGEVGTRALGPARVASRCPRGRD